MYKSILAPLDGSKRAEAILPHLEHLALHYDAKVIFLQVIEQTMLFVNPESYEMEMKAFQEKAQQAKIYLDELKETFEKKGIKAIRSRRMALSWRVSSRRPKVKKQISLR